MADDTWRRCSSCKNAIAFGDEYWVCNVSTCNRKRTGLVFCTVSCWEVHLPTMNHRESWAVDRHAPSRGQWEREQAAERAAGGSSATAVAGTSAPASGGNSSEPRAPRRIVPSQPESVSTAPRQEDVPREILVVASRLKSYVLARTGLKTSEGVLDALSDVLRAFVDAAAENAYQAERKTLLDRDVPTANPRR